MDWLYVRSQEVLIAQEMNKQVQKQQLRAFDWFNKEWTQLMSISKVDDQNGIFLPVQLWSQMEEIC